MLDDNNGVRYWPDNYPSSEDSTNANKLTQPKANQKNQKPAVLQLVAPTPGEALGLENRSDFTNFSFAAGEEDTEGPGISSVRPLRPQENNADMGQGGQFDGAVPNNATDNISPPDPNPRPRSTEESEPSGKFPRPGNVARRYIPCRNRRRPRNDDYISEGTMEEYIWSSTSSESDFDSDTQYEQMDNGTENVEECPPGPTIVTNEEARLAAGMPIDDRNVKEIAADIWNEHLGQHNTDTGRNETMTPPPLPSTRLQDWGLMGCRIPKATSITTLVKLGKPN
ncbi:unnamed protein product [Clonostachys byssicola]|uniref:Uncharacterized protein n=1 Tax=Clonostachys byssicola TaxID=160290 RepID=A0A9N9YB67_9HYPO|nr:unnamed protein product [Clonostachys byssicola]